MFAARPADCWLLVLRPVLGRESAGCVCLQCLVQQAVCLLAFVIPLPFSSFLPLFSLFCFTPVHSMCARIISLSTQHVCKLQDCPVGSCNTGLQRRPVRRFLTYPSFPADSMILGHGLV